MPPNDGRVVSNFIVQALSGQDITVYGDGSQTRAFCYVDDLIDGFVGMMGTGREVTGPVNLGCVDEMPMRDLAELVIMLVGSKSKVVYRPLPTDDPRQRQPDLTKARALLDWRPRVGLEHGLKQTINYFDALLGQGGRAALGPRANAA